MPDIRLCSPRQWSHCKLGSAGAACTTQRCILMFLMAAASYETSATGFTRSPLPRMELQVPPCFRRCCCCFVLICCYRRRRASATTRLCCDRAAAAAPSSSISSLWTDFNHAGRIYSSKVNSQLGFFLFFFLCFCFWRPVRYPVTA